MREFSGQVPNHPNINELTVVITTYKALRVGAAGYYRYLLRLFGGLSATALPFKDRIASISGTDKTGENAGSPIQREDAVPQEQTIKFADVPLAIEEPDFMAIDFLPIVTGSAQIEDEDTDAAVNETGSKKNIQIPVAWDFLPIIVDNNMEADSIATKGNRYRYDTSLKNREDALVRDFYVVYEEYRKGILEEDKEKSTDKKKDRLAKTPMSVGEIDLRSLYDREVSFEQIDAIPEDVRETEDPYGKSIEDDHLLARDGNGKPPEPGDDEPTLNFLLKPIFLSDYEQSLNQTLDDLEEMGDEREIPLLLEYLEHQKNDMIQERIHVLLKKFVQWEPKPKKNATHPATEFFLPEYNVIRELFNSCDLEAKIILLDSVVDVMDKEDVDFLKDLLNHPDPEIKKRAKKNLHTLAQRLALPDDRSNGNDKGFAYGTRKNEGPVLREAFNGPENKENPFDFELDLFPGSTDGAERGQASKDPSVLRELKHSFYSILEKIRA